MARRGHYRRRRSRGILHAPFHDSTPGSIDYKTTAKKKRIRLRITVATAIILSTFSYLNVDVWMAVLLSCWEVQYTFSAVSTPSKALSCYFNN